MGKIMDWIKKFFCRPKVAEDEYNSKNYLSEERQDELWKMFQKSPELFDFYEHNGYRFVTYKETGEYFWF